MGMTDLQFKSHLRQLIRSLDFLEEKARKEGAEGTAEEIASLKQSYIEDLQG